MDENTSDIDRDLLARELEAVARLVVATQAPTEVGSADTRQTEVENNGVGRFTIDGPDIGIASSAVITLAMTLNELCTNTTKFGALSVPAGRVEIAWRL